MLDRNSSDFQNVKLLLEVLIPCVKKGVLLKVFVIALAGGKAVLFKRSPDDFGFGFMLHSHTWWKSSPPFSDVEHCVASGHAAAKVSCVFHLAEQNHWILAKCYILHFAPLQCIPTQLSY